MKILLTISTVICMLISSSNSFGKVLKIKFTEDDAYSLEVARINVGDTIEWLPENEGHNVEFFAGPKMHSLPKKSEIDAVHTITFRTPGVYLYGCTPHGNMGMLGLVVVGNNFDNIEKIKETQLSRVASSVLKRLVRMAQSGSN